MMKPLEQIFFRACVNEQKRKLHTENREFDIRTIGNIFERLGFSYKQLMYYVNKWADKGFYEYGVSLDLGWFKFDKLTGEYKQIYEEMASVDRWDDREFARYIVKRTFLKGHITNYALKKMLDIGEDAEFFDPYRSESK
ncbi:MAG: hypothetical protein EGR48_00255 [Lachnospiraceae bacterium]|nr:hypothetical protein [Lachnospiraceae bacterium]